MSVFVLASDGKPVMPCLPKRARLLLERKKAKVVKIKPFTIQLLDRDSDSCELQDLSVKIDPGSKTTGFAVVRYTVEKAAEITAIWLMELKHRGAWIKKKLQQRAAYRKNRRARNTRYRSARFLNRTKPTGWLAPSLMHRIVTTINWVKKLMRFTPLTEITYENVTFDMQKMQNPDIQNSEYQTGTLFEKEVMEYLLEKWNHTCAYCGATGTQFEKEHVIPKAHGGSNRISNLVLSCIPCNRKKGILPIEVFLAKDPLKLIKIKSQLKKPLLDAAAVNATRKRLLKELILLGLPVSAGTGAMTKYNRKRFFVEKTHAHDAVCVGTIGNLIMTNVKHLYVSCVGRGKYSRTQTNKYGFPKYYLMKEKKAFGFATGDLVRVFWKSKDMINPISKWITARITIKARGIFTYMYDRICCSTTYSRIMILQKSDGYSY